MISVVLPTLNAAASLPDGLGALVPAAISGLIAEVIVADGGSTDGTKVIADAMGARLVEAEGGRGRRLAAAARVAKSNWLMFLPPDVVLEPAWENEVESFVTRSERARTSLAAAFRFALDDPSPAARRAELWARLRCRLLRLPFGDQGLLIGRGFYEELGGFADLPVMEDVDLVRRIGGERIVLLKAAALSSAPPAGVKRAAARPGHNLAALAHYYLRVPPRMLARLAG